MKLMVGVDPELEAEADRLIRESLVGLFKQSAKSDILTAWKEIDRRSREVYVTDGTPDEALMKGIYHRSLNRRLPHLNGNDGVVQRKRPGRSMLGAYIQEIGMAYGGSTANGRWV